MLSGSYPFEILPILSQCDFASCNYRSPTGPKKETLKPQLGWHTRLRWRPNDWKILTSGRVWKENGDSLSAMGTHHFEKEPVSSHAKIHQNSTNSKMSEWMSVVKEIQRAFQAQIVQLVIKHALSWMCIASIMQNKWASLHEGGKRQELHQLWWYLPNNVRNTCYQHMISKWLWMTGLYMTRDYVTLCISLKKHKHQHGTPG